MSPFKMKGFPYAGKPPTKHGTTDDFLYGRNGHNPDIMEGSHEDWHTDRIELTPEEKKEKGETPNKQVSAHGQESDYEREKEEDLKRGNYTYELVDANGNVIKTISKEEYLVYENKPGTDEPTKTTNDPDPYGRNTGGSVTNPK